MSLSKVIRNMDYGMFIFWGLGVKRKEAVDTPPSEVGNVLCSIRPPLVVFREKA